MYDDYDNMNKCTTPECNNAKYAGNFKGNLCNPCHAYYTKELERTGEGSQAFKNHMDVCKSYLKAYEIYLVEQKYK
jgi:hypothetical protein